MNSAFFRLPTSGNERLRDYALTAFLAVQTLILFIAAPLAAMGTRFPLVFGGLLCGALLLIIVVISRSVGARILATFAVVLAAGGAILRISHPSLVTVWLGHGAVILALLAISLVIAQAVFAPGRITHHRLEGAIVLYLNGAMAFTSIYRMIMELDATAFAGVSVDQTEAAAVGNMLYFSFTTLTSTGFGEILPVNPFGRSMANLEAVLGQLYLAILLARLVTMHGETRQE
jgi:hypothetical protein